MRKKSYKDRIRFYLKKHDFISVTYEGPVRMMGWSKILFYDAEFFELDGPHSLSPREFRYGFEVREDMEKVISIFKASRIRHGTVVSV